MTIRNSPRSLDDGRTCCILAVLVIFSSFVAVFFVIELHHGEAVSIREAAGFKRPLAFSMENTTAFSRKILQSTGGDDEGGGDGGRNRIGTGCSKDDIVIYQGTAAPLPSGIPSYTVQILNACASGCAISNIHLSCGWFSSASLINPRVFRRLVYDDCLVNNGDPLGPGQTISFQYANTFQYPLSVSTIACS